MDPTDFANGVMCLGKFVNELPAAMEHCTEMSADIVRIEDWAAPFMWPQILWPTLTINIAKHWNELV